MNNPCSPVPLLFITGFLGSGKTTLLNRVLDEAAAQGKKIGVIINEWGRVNIDSSLIRAKDIEICLLYTSCKDFQPYPQQGRLLILLRVRQRHPYP